MSIERIRSVPEVADPVGPFSHAVVSDGLVFTSGQLPVGPTGEAPEDFEGQVEAALTNLTRVLRAAGSDVDRVLSVRAFLTDPAQLETYNRVYDRHFGEHRPARTTVGVALWGVSLEIDCIARTAEAS